MMKVKTKITKEMIDDLDKLNRIDADKLLEDIFMEELDKVSIKRKISKRKEKINDILGDEDAQS